jgi:hypothetical protein
VRGRIEIVAVADNVNVHDDCVVVDGDVVGDATKAGRGLGRRTEAVRLSAAVCAQVRGTLPRARAAPDNITHGWQGLSVLPAAARSQVRQSLQVFSAADGCCSQQLQNSSTLHGLS